MFHFPDSDTGYYDTEEAFYALDAEIEAAEERAYLDELEASHGCDFDARPMMPPDYVDPETGCTPAEMEEADRMPLRVLRIGDVEHTPSDPASHVTFPPEMSVSQTIAARWGRGARRRKGVA
jgi:hypothetical protein